MANKKITDLPAATAAAATQVFEVVNDPAGTPASQKVTGTQLITLILNYIAANIITFKQLNTTHWQFTENVGGDLTFATPGNPGTAVFFVNCKGFTFTASGGDGDADFELDTDFTLNFGGNFNINGGVGQTGSFTSLDGKTIDVTNGVITGIT